MLGRNKKPKPTPAPKYPITTIEARPPKIKYETENHIIEVEESGSVTIVTKTDLMSWCIWISYPDVSKVISGLQFVLPHAEGVSNDS